MRRCLITCLEVEALHQKPDWRSRQSTATARRDGTSLKNVLRGHPDPTTNTLYDRGGHNPEKGATLLAND